jgi:hypothetical protein
MITSIQKNNENSFPLIPPTPSAWPSLEPFVSKYYLSLPPDAINSSDAASGATIFSPPHVFVASNIVVASSKNVVSTNMTRFNISPPPDATISNDAASGSLAQAMIFFPSHVVVASNIIVAVNKEVAYTNATLVMMTLSLPLQRCLMELSLLPFLKTYNRLPLINRSTLATRLQNLASSELFHLAVRSYVPEAHGIE